ncbi:MAG: geranylgeranylglyceryl/heptaprenylglyceryl phosphate synthase, partial [Candidatus Bathyarchaeia archaeon]
MKTVESRLEAEIKQHGTIHFVLIDPDKATPPTAANIAKAAEDAGSSAVLVGGSTVAHTNELDGVVRAVKKTVKIPVILFPGNITGISPHADAIFFMSLLNSSNPYFIVGAQVLGAPLIRRFKLEAIPLGYVILGDGGSAGLMGHARPLPYDKPDLAAMYALAAQYLGMRFIYLEAGSGAPQPVPHSLVVRVRKTVDAHLI